MAPTPPPTGGPVLPAPQGPGHHRGPALGARVAGRPPTPWRLQLCWPSAGSEEPPFPQPRRIHFQQQEHQLVRQRSRTPHDRRGISPPAAAPRCRAITPRPSTSQPAPRRRPVTGGGFRLRLMPLVIWLPFLDAAGAAPHHSPETLTPFGPPSLRASPREKRPTVGWTTAGYRPSTQRKVLRSVWPPPGSRWRPAEPSLAVSFCKYTYFFLFCSTALPSGRSVRLVDSWTLYLL